MRRLVLPTILCLCALFLLVACTERKEGAVVVKVGKETITDGDLDLLVKVNPRLKNRMATPAGRKQIVENYVEQALLYQEALKQGVDRDPLVKAKANLYRKIILAQGLLEKSLEQAITDYYKNNHDEFEKVKIAHIYIPFKFEGKNPAIDKDTNVKRSPEQAEAKIKTIAAKLKKDATQFSELAKENSEHKQSRKKGGELGWVTVNAPRFQRLGWAKVTEQTFALNEGGISDPIRSDNGYHLVKVLAGKKLDSFEEAKSRIRFKVQSKVKAKLVNELKGQYDIAYAEGKKAEKKLHPAVDVKAESEKGKKAD